MCALILLCFLGLVHSVFLPALLVVILLRNPLRPGFTLHSFKKDLYVYFVCLSLYLICRSTFPDETGFALYHTGVVHLDCGLV